jgi:sulfate transport system permease protein
MARKSNVMPGFRLSMGFTLFYLGIIVLLPVGGLLIKAFGMTWAEFLRVTTNDRAMAAYKLTFGASFIAAAINACFGSILAWALVRYHFPGKRLLDALVDIPFAMPTAVAGLTLANLFSPNGWLGNFLVPLGIKGSNTRLGVVIALTFVSLPFVVRTLQPILENLERELEEAAATLGAGRLLTFRKVIFPVLMPTIITGFALSFARAIGEYGSVIFISSNIQYEGEIAPLVIITMLEQYEFSAAIGIAVVLLAISFCMLISINLLERWAAKFQR